MPQARIRRELTSGVYFVTPTVWNWYYVFDRHDRWQILADSIRYLQERRGLVVHAYVFMLNHIHLILEAEDTIAALRDFKRHTSREIKANIAHTEPKVLALFVTPDGGFRFWKEDNKPKRIESVKFYLQKMRYIENNPVFKGYVERPEHWKWSSANSLSPIRTVRGSEAQHEQWGRG